MQGEYIPVKAFVEAWEASPLYKSMLEEVDGPLEDPEHFSKEAIVSEKFHLRAGRYFKVRAGITMPGWVHACRKVLCDVCVCV